MADPSFKADRDGLEQALELLFSRDYDGEPHLPSALPTEGLGEETVLELLAPTVLGGAERLGTETAFAHMDPPTPWIAWAATLWNASLNQNLLHPDLSPVAKEVEARVSGWLAPFFGMDGGHMTPGSTVANLTAIWAARDLTGARQVVASEAAHLSVPKAAHLLGMEYVPVRTGADGVLDPTGLPATLERSVLVMTAGSTSAGAIDPLTVAGDAAWTHVDAAWAGPLRLSDKHAHLLAGIELADSIAVSAHKWLFQPKESGLVLFRHTAAAHAAISFGGTYLAQPNVGLLGSHGAVAVPLLATLLAWGRQGIAERIERCMEMANDLHARLSGDPRIVVFGPNRTGVILWRPADQAGLASVSKRLPRGVASRTSLGGQDWFRQVAANPEADIDTIWRCIETAL